MLKLLFAALAAVLCFAGQTGADLCSLGSVEIDGNWYCQPVQAIQYSNVGSAGTYNQITAMNADGNCSSVPKAFSGPLSPLDEEVSLHFRGPLQLKQFAAYAPSTFGKVSHRGFPHAHRHQQLHNRVEAKGPVAEEQKRQEVTATIDGKVVSWQNNWFGESSVAAPASHTSAEAAPQEVTATIDGQVVSWVWNPFGASKTSTPLTKPPVTTPAEVKNADASIEAATTSYPQTKVTSQVATASLPDNVDATDAASTYDRIGFYDSASQTLDNLVFLGNHGGQGSGVFDYMFGASLAYVDRDGTGGSSSPQILADTTLPSDSEIVIMLGQECGNGDCGYVRPGAIAYHGFGGADKVFLFEFSMPMDKNTGFNGDMPAIWMLNAQIPRTVQYGNAACSCWESGCGEFDIVEALHTGSTYLKSTLHTNTPGGDSDYIERPTSGTMKLAVVFRSSTSTIHIQVLPDATEFSSSLTASEIHDFCSSSTGHQLSLFTIS